MRIICKFLNNEKGVTLPELLVTIAAAAILALPIYQLLTQTSMIQSKLINQADVQESAQIILNQIVEGKANQNLGGLRQASSVITSGNAIAFVVGNNKVTYYLNGTSLFYKDEMYSPPLNINTSNGIKILQNVTDFSPSVINGLYMISLTVKKNDSSQATYEVKVNPRNL